MNVGDRVQIQTTNGLTYEGIVLPGKLVTLKLDSGYNVGIDERNISSKKILGVKPSAPKVKEILQKNSELDSILIIHTGGTIASKVDYETGGTTNLITPEELLGMYPELQTIANVQAKLLFNMSSEDMRFAHYNAMMYEIKRALKENPSLKGIIITQGTDMMHYAAAALHYGLQRINVPVVLTGSQRSADRGSSDAPSNLFAATQFITQTNLSGVYVCMHHTLDDTSVGIYWGLQARKMHTARRDAFTPVNVPEVATVLKDQVIIHWEPPKGRGELRISPYNPDLRIGMLYIRPNMFAQEFLGYEDFDGLVILGTGLGHVPITHSDEQNDMHEEILKAIGELVKKIPVVMTSQCIYGRIGMNVYSSGRRMLDLGVLGQDMALTPEATYMKLAYLLSIEADPKEFSQDLGDRIARSEEQGYDQ